MKRSHRTWHLSIWLILGPLIAIVVILSVMWRPSVPVEPKRLADDLPRTQLPTVEEVAP
jgi:hypothetical protein